MSIKSKLADVFHFNDDDEFIPSAKVYPEKNNAESEKNVETNVKRKKATIQSIIIASIVWGFISAAFSVNGVQLGAIPYLIVVAITGAAVYNSASFQEEDDEKEESNSEKTACVKSDDEIIQSVNPETLRTEAERIARMGYLQAIAEAKTAGKRAEVLSIPGTGMEDLAKIFADEKDIAERRASQIINSHVMQDIIARECTVSDESGIL